jgi:hypothetical protein
VRQFAAWIRDERGRLGCHLARPLVLGRGQIERAGRRRPIARSTHAGGWNQAGSHARTSIAVGIEEDSQQSAQIVDDLLAEAFAPSCFGGL